MVAQHKARHSQSSQRVDICQGGGRFEALSLNWQKNLKGELEKTGPLGPPKQASGNVHIEMTQFVLPPVLPFAKHEWLIFRVGKNLVLGLVQMVHVGTPCILQGLEATMFWDCAINITVKIWRKTRTNGLSIMVVHNISKNYIHLTPRTAALRC